MVICERHQAQKQGTGPKCLRTNRLQIHGGLLSSQATASWSHPLPDQDPNPPEAFSVKPWSELTALLEGAKGSGSLLLVSV